MLGSRLSRLYLIIYVFPWIITCLYSVLQRHSDVSDGTFDFTLKEVNLSDKAGTWLEQKLETLTVGQVLEKAAQSEEKLRELALDQSEKELQALQAQKERLQIQVI